MGSSHTCLLSVLFEAAALLFEYFMEGEKSGRKKSAGEVHLLLRDKLETHEYVTSQQIKGLYSRWSKQYREGTLKKPTAKDGELVVADDEPIDDELAENYETELDAVATQVTNPWQVDDWVVITYKGERYPGKITKIDHKGTWVNCLKPRAGKDNCFYWPKKKDHMPYEDTDIVSIIEDPVPCSNGGDVRLLDKDFANAFVNSDGLKLVLRQYIPAEI